MELEKIIERRKDNLNRLDIAKMDIEYREIELRKNLEYIKDVLSFIKKLKKIKYCFNYIKANWYYNSEYENEIEETEKRIEDYSNLYEKRILERKILKLKLKQAQREFTKKQKSLIRFEKKYFNEEVQKNGKR